MIMFLHGPDTYRSRQRLQTLRRAFITKHDPQGHSIVRIDGSQLTLEQFNAAVKSTGLLAAKRLVIIERLLTDNRKTTVASAIAEFITHEKASDDAIVIFWEGDVTSEKKPKRSAAKKPTAAKKKKASGPSLLEVLLLQKHVEYFEVLPTPQIKQWAANQFKNNGVTIDPSALDLLVENSGSDLWRLHNEIDALSSYRPGKAVTTPDVKLFSPGTFHETIFSLTDAIGEKRQAEALRLMHQFLVQGEPPLYLLAMLIRQFRILVNVSLVAAQEPNYQTVARRLSLHPFVAQKAVRQATLFDLNKLASLYNHLVSLDRRFKTTREDPALLFDQFVLAACA